ncbi:MAG: glutathione S-transferase [Rhodospirillales bacterium]|jgi:glutathione S-transferase|nr:glutathione S-transferase [Rhodospirillales bacterium]
MYTLYWSKRTRAASVHMLLEESGIPYQLHNVDIDKGDHRSPEYLKINPKGFVPTLVTDSGQILTETPAMLMHIADTNDTKGLVPAPNDPARGQFLDWFFYHVCVLQEPYKRFHFPERYTTQENHTDAVSEHASQTIEDKWNYVEKHLQKNGPFHMGEQFGLNDILLATYCVFSCGIPDFSTRFPAVVQCYKKVKSRPTLNKILLEHGNDLIF